MAYSRWSNSRWYTFWCVHPTDSKKRNEQIFEICDFPTISFTFKELSDNLPECLSRVKSHFAQEHKGNILKDIKKKPDGSSELIYEETTWGPVVTKDSELKELTGYMKKFIKDVLTDPDLED